MKNIIFLIGYKLYVFLIILVIYLTKLKAV